MISKKNIFVSGVGIISPQKTFDNTEFLPWLTEYDSNILSCIVPDFKEYFEPGQLRRLSRMLRIGMAASMICIKDSEQTININGIITATGYGFLDYTAKFLEEILKRNEEMLTPTYFIQSTYNALSGMTGLSFKCTGYNNTYVSKGFAFESALMDAMMQLNEKDKSDFLIGSYDEASPVQYVVNFRVGHYKNEKIKNTELYNSKTNGTLQGEGAAFFTLSNRQSEKTYCILKDMQMIYRPDDPQSLFLILKSFLARNEISLNETDVFINGMSGDYEKDKINSELSTLINKPQILFKHLCGEYTTASSFALWLGAKMIKHQVVPPILNPGTAINSINHVLICNHYMGRNYSLMLLARN